MRKIWYAVIGIAYVPIFALQILSIILFSVFYSGSTLTIFGLLLLLLGGVYLAFTVFSKYVFVYYCVSFGLLISAYYIRRRGDIRRCKRENSENSK